MPSAPSKDLVAIPNPHPDREYEVECVCPEFTCVCPMTGQPDFATFTIVYTPGPHIVELKSLKLYLWSFRDEGHFHEDVTNRVLDDLIHTLQPRRMSVVSAWNVRGGITTRVRVCYPNPPVRID
jgi:7-cyano-7-deazaguanine reductase